MNPKKISLISVAVNIVLVVIKLAIGLFSNSVALIAESVHSGLDVASSVVTFLGIKAAEKPADEEHPYGHERYESVSGFLVVLLLFVSGCWILYEAVPALLEGHPSAHFNIWGIVIMSVSVIANEVMSRVKYYFGHKFSSISLIADGKHSRADVLASVGVLIALIVIKVYPLADSLIAVFVALYIFYETYQLVKETIDSILDTANPELEEKIKQIMVRNNLKFTSLRTRKVGGTNMVEMTLIFDPKLTLAEAALITKGIEETLISEPEIKQIILNAKSDSIDDEILKDGKERKIHIIS